MSKAGWFGVVFVGAGLGLLLFFLAEDWVTESHLEMVHWPCESYQFSIDDVESKLDTLLAKHAPYLNEIPPTNTLRDSIRSERAFTETWWSNNELPKLRETYLHGQDDVWMAFWQEEERIRTMFAIREGELQKKLRAVEVVLAKIEDLPKSLEESRTRLDEVSRSPVPIVLEPGMSNRFADQYPERGPQVKARVETLRAVLEGLRSAHTALEIAMEMQSTRYYEMALLADYAQGCTTNSSRHVGTVN